MTTVGNPSPTPDNPSMEATEGPRRHKNCPSCTCRGGGSWVTYDPALDSRQRARYLHDFDGHYAYCDTKRCRNLAGLVLVRPPGTRGRLRFYCGGCAKEIGWSGTPVSASLPEAPPLDRRGPLRMPELRDPHQSYAYLQDFEQRVDAISLSNEQLAVVCRVVCRRWAVWPEQLLSGGGGAHVTLARYVTWCLTPLVADGLDVIKLATTFGCQSEDIAAWQAGGAETLASWDTNLTLQERQAMLHALLVLVHKGQDRPS